MSGSIAGLSRAIGSGGAVLGNVGNVARGIKALGTDLGIFDGGLTGGTGTGVPAAGLGVWAQGLQVASWNGVRFAVRESTIKRGRRVAVHEYPFRDQVWVEDLGRATRLFTFRGFLVGDDVYDQREKMVRAAEKMGQGELVHPSIGTLNCGLVEFAASERAEAGRVVELEFAFIETAPPPPPPQPAADTQDKSKAATDAAKAAAATDFKSQAKAGLLAIQTGIKTAQGYVKYAVRIGGDVGMIAGGVTGIAGVFGRYTVGKRTTLQNANATVASALGAVTSARAAMGTAGSSVTSLANLFT